MVNGEDPREERKNEPSLQKRPYSYSFYSLYLESIAHYSTVQYLINRDYSGSLPAHEMQNAKCKMQATGTSYKQTTNK